MVEKTTILILEKAYNILWPVPLITIYCMCRVEFIFMTEISKKIVNLIFNFVNLFLRHGV